MGSQSRLSCSRFGHMSQEGCPGPPSFCGLQHSQWLVNCQASMSTSYLETPPPTPLRSYGGGPVIGSFRRIPEIPLSLFWDFLGQAGLCNCGGLNTFWYLDCANTRGSKYEVNITASLRFIQREAPFSRSICLEGLESRQEPRSSHGDMAAWQRPCQLGLQHQEAVGASTPSQRCAFLLTPLVKFYHLRVFTRTRCLSSPWFTT